MKFDHSRESLSFIVSIQSIHSNQSCWINIFAITIKVDIKLSAMIDQISLLVQELSLLLGTEIGK